MLLLALALSPASVYAQHVVSPQSVPLASRTPFEREVGRALVCMCGTCGRKLAGECECGDAAQMRDEIAMLARQGKTQEGDSGATTSRGTAARNRLAEPIDEGFNRLAWMLPYMLGAAGLVTIVLTARRWSRPAAAAPCRRRDADRSGSRRPPGR